ncbi:MAG: hypothetical protein ACLFN4_06180 [Candidatus Acetothermia bacterium]
MSNRVGKSASVLLFLSLLILVFPGREGLATDSFNVRETEVPARLQSLINPKGEPNQLVWLGADAATSVPVTPDHYVWLFGDTILGENQNGIRNYSEFIHNTIGVTRRNANGKFEQIEKFYRQTKGNVEAIFPSEEEGEFYWPLVGTVVDSSLLIAASRVSTENDGGFKILGTTFFLVDNPLDIPPQWEYEKSYLPKEEDTIWGTALVAEEEWVYVFGQRGTGLDSETVLSRIRIEDAATGNWEKRLHYVDRDWKTNSKPQTLEGLPGTSETTIQYNSFFGWYCLQIPPLGNDVHLFTAEEITGPWRDQGSVYAIPSPWSTEKTENGKQVFITYAAKSHPELASEENEIVLTYNINLSPYTDKDQKLQDYIGQKKYERLYVPQFVSLLFEKTE